MGIFREILTPDSKNHSVRLPEYLFGRKVEIIAFEINEEIQSFKKSSLKNKGTVFLKDIEFIPDFPSIHEIRKQAWPEKKK